MIYSVRSDNSHFKTVEFTSGFNVILADRTKESTQKDTRNGLGKSTLIEIIHFCLGASARRGSGLLVKPLEGWSFILDLDLAGKKVSISRQISAPSFITIEGDTSDWPIKPKQSLHGLEMSISDWCQLLGALMFGLTPDENSGPYAPTFRSLVSYFIRRGRDAYSIPFEHHRKQKEVEKQVLNAFLLDLEWGYAKEWQEIKDKRNLLDDLLKASKTGLVNTLLGSVGELEALRIRLKEKSKEEERQLNSFRVHPQYRDIEDQSNLLTDQIHSLSNDNISDGKILSLYESSIGEEKEPAPKDVTMIYEELGILLPDMIRKRLDDVYEFHRNIVENRRNFLSIEISRLNRAITDRRHQIRQKADERASLMEILRTHGALEEHSLLQQRHLDTVTQLKDTEQRIDNLQKFEQSKSDLLIKQELLLQRARQDLSEREEQKRKAIALFNTNSQALYRVPGNLVIDITETGYKFNVEIERDKSEGIGNMKVFCYDLMLIEVWSNKEYSPVALIHDSIIFDGVDERQIALALELAQRESSLKNFQYICTLNSDNVPWGDFSTCFDLNDYIRLKLTDVTEDGGLLGIRY